MKYIVTSDIHLGHNNTPTKHIASSFKKFILNEQNKDTDVLFINGDLLDQLVDLKSLESHELLSFFHYLLDYCYSNNICLRVLEGTPDHDWEQSQHLVTINNARKNKCDLVYHKALNIEYVERLKKYVLYVPDEWVHNHDLLEAQIQDKMNELGIDKVDLAMMHGQFAYQFAGRPYKGFHFKEEYFLKIVKEYIHVGHYHNFSTFDRIIANGSLERMVHGDENPKGYVVVKDGVFTFVENTDAYIYKTIRVNKGHTLDKLDKIIANYPVGSFIRLSMKADHPFNLTFKDLRIRYSLHNLKKIVEDDVSDRDGVTYILTESDVDFDDVLVIQSNIHETLINIVKSKYELTPEENKKFMNYINIFKGDSGEELSAI